MTNVRTAVEKANQPGVGALVDQYRQSFSTVLPTHVKADQWIRVAQGVLRRDPKLVKAAKANPNSLLSALLDCARLGLEPGDTYHLVPFGNEVTGITDYTGEIELIYRAGEVTAVKAEVVRANDVFMYDPAEMDRPHHQIDWFGDRGDLVGAYSFATMRNGGTSRVVVMSRREIEEEHRDVNPNSRNKNSPWQKNPAAMYLKTVAKQLKKWVPSSAEYRSEVLRAEASVDQVSNEHPELAMPEDDYIDGEVIDDAPPAEVDGNGMLDLEPKDET